MTRVLEAVEALALTIESGWSRDATLAGDPIAAGPVIFDRAVPVEASIHPCCPYTKVK